MVKCSIMNAFKCPFEEKNYLHVIHVTKEHLVSTAEAWRSLSLGQFMFRFFIYICPQTSYSDLSSNGIFIGPQ